MNVLDHPALAEGNIIVAVIRGDPVQSLWDAAAPEPSADCRRETIEMEIDAGGVCYQRCGGGRRVIRKQLGN